MTPGRPVTLQRQGNQIVASFAPAPAYRAPKPSLPMPKVCLDAALAHC